MPTHRLHCVRLALRVPVLGSVAALVIALGPLLAGRLSAQDAGEPPLMAREFQELREINGQSIFLNKTARQNVQNMLRNGTFTPEEQKQFDEYFRYRVAELTWIENIPLLPKLRKVLKSQDLMRSGEAPDQKVHTYLNDLLLRGLTNMATNEAYHPASRLSCILIVGQLDEKEPKAFEGGAVPLPAALPKLLEVMQDSKQIDAVRIGASVGVLRHVEQGTTAEGKKLVVPALEAIVKTKTPAGISTQVGNDWLRRRAVQAIDAMAAAKWPEVNQLAMAGALQQYIDDSHVDLLARSEAAHALGQLEKGVFTGKSALAMNGSIAALAAVISINGVSADAGKVGSEFLTICLMNTQVGLKGVSAAATDPTAKEMVSELSRRIGDLVSVAHDKNLPDGDRNDNLKKKGEDLQEYLRKSGVSPAGNN
jgi:hypothetical protein